MRIRDANAPRARVLVTDPRTKKSKGFTVEGATRDELVKDLKTYLGERQERRRREPQPA